MPAHNDMCLDPCGVVYTKVVYTIVVYTIFVYTIFQLYALDLLW